MKRRLGFGVAALGLLAAASSAGASHSGITAWYTNPAAAVHCSSARFTGGSGTISAWIEVPFTQGPYRPVNQTSSICITPTYDRWGYSASH